MPPISVQLIDSINTVCQLDGLRQYENIYRVIMDSRADGPLTARDAAGIPSPGDTWQDLTNSDPWAHLTGYRDIRRVDSKEAARVYTVTVTYSTKPIRKRDDTLAQNPLDEPAAIQGAGQRFQRPAYIDRLGNPLNNSADQLIEDLQIEDHRRQMTITKNYATIDLAQFDDFTDKLNSATFFALPAERWKMAAPSWRQEYYGNNTPYYRVTFTFEARDDWQLTVYDAGTKYLDANGTLKKMDDDEGVATGRKSFLTDGVATATHRGDKLPTGGSPEELSWDIYETRDFALLDIPVALPT